MNFRLLAMVLLASLNLQIQDRLIPSLTDAYKTLENKITDVNIQGFNIDLKRKTVKYHSLESNLYFQIKKDHNGESLYVLTYNFNSEDVQAYLEKLQRALQG